jgi:hypothetical protein
MRKLIFLTITASMALLAVFLFPPMQSDSRERDENHEGLLRRGFYRDGFTVVVLTHWEQVYPPAGRKFSNPYVKPTTWRRIENFDGSFVGEKDENWVEQAKRAWVDNAPYRQHRFLQFDLREDRRPQFAKWGCLPFGKTFAPHRVSAARTLFAGDRAVFYPDAFRTNGEGFDRVDHWIGGSANRKVHSVPLAPDPDRLDPPPDARRRIEPTIPTPRQGPVLGLWLRPHRQHQWRLPGMRPPR